MKLKNSYVLLIAMIFLLVSVGSVCAGNVSNDTVIPDDGKDIVTNESTITEPSKKDTEIVTEDNIQVERSFSELTSQDFEQHDYYLSYIPGGDNNKIIPTTEKIKIKIIIRKYNNDARCLIKNVTINKFGGALEWN